MVAGVTAVIAVLRGNVMIVGVKPDGAVTHARLNGQLLRELPLGLQVGIKVPHQVTFVTAFVTLHAKIRHAVVHHKVFIPAAIFTHIFVVKAGGKRYRHQQQLAAVGPAGINTLIMALHINYAARMRRIFSLRGIRNGLVLGHFTLTGVHHHAEVVLFAQLTVVADPSLGLLNGFTRIVLIATG